MVEAKTGVSPREQRLIYAGKQLDESKCLSNYPKLGPNSTIYLVLRLLGGTTNHGISDRERDTPRGPDLECSINTPCMICFTHPHDDDHYDAKRLPLIMPCTGSHTAMHPHCLMMYCQNEIFDNKREAVCCSQCKKEWTLDIIEKYGAATKEEIEIFSNALSVNFMDNDPQISECPGCTSYCQRQDTSNVRVRCRICTKQKGKNFDFCWYCKQDWLTSGTTDCSNPECKDAGILAQIKDAPEKEVVGVRCPSIRLCPNCGTPIEHKSACKQMTCKECSCEFCFICLRPKRDSSWQCGNYNDKCAPAPRQEKVPKRPKLLS